MVWQDPEVGWENPSELKAQKLARSAARGLVDRDLKPDTEERRRISALLLYPPNRCVIEQAKHLNTCLCVDIHCSMTLNIAKDCSQPELLLRTSYHFAPYRWSS